MALHLRTTVEKTRRCGLASLIAIGLAYVRWGLLAAVRPTVDLEAGSPFRPTRSLNFEDDEDDTVCEELKLQMRAKTRHNHKGEGQTKTKFGLTKRRRRNWAPKAKLDTTQPRR